jgi:hypothetical protein
MQRMRNRFSFILSQCLPARGSQIAGLTLDVLQLLDVLNRLAGDLDLARHLQLDEQPEIQSRRESRYLGCQNACH